MSEEAKNKITVTIKLPNGEVIKVPTSPNTTFKEFLITAMKTDSQLKSFGCVKFSYTPRNPFDHEKKSEQGNEIVSKWYVIKHIHIKRDETRDEYYLKIGDFSWYKDEYELSLIKWNKDPVNTAIDLNDFVVKSNDKSSAIESTGFNKSVGDSAKINWPRIIVGGITLFLLAVTATLFLLFFLSSLNIPLTAPVVFAVVSLVAFVFWVAWNNIVPKNLKGGMIHMTPLSEDSNDFIKKNGFENAQPEHENTSKLNLKEADN